MTHQVNYRIYYEDTDAGGVVYYANYLKFAERARTELLRSKNINQSELIENDDLLFVVRKASIELLSPARLDDLITIKTSVKTAKGPRIEMIQDIYRDDKKLAEIEVLIVAVNSKMKPVKLPESIQTILVN